MQCIYKLEFDSGDFYIGQTCNLEKRLISHISTKGKGSPKLQNAFEKYKYLGHKVIEETEDLDNREIYWIELLKPTLNILIGGKSNRGFNSPRSKYTKEQILEVIRLYCDTCHSLTDISVLTDVNISTVHDVIKGRTHIELFNKPIMEEAARVRNTIYRFYDGSGNQINLNRVDFYKTYGIYPESILNSVKGNYKNLIFVSKPQILTIVSDEGIEFTDNIPALRSLIKDFKVPQYSIERVFKGYISKGWYIKKSFQETKDA
jgi:group I intron endonuclease